MRRCIGALVSFALLLAPLASLAHESRPAYLELKETAPAQFAVLWRTPVLAGMQLPVVLRMPDGARNVKAPEVHELTDSLVERRWVDAGPGGLAGQRFDFPGLQVTITDVLVRVQHFDGRTYTLVARPSAPFVEIAESRGTAATAVTFLTQGIEHILLGVDHLLFVFGLLLIVRTPWMLVKTVTAFTVAHSITLAIATLGYARVPAPPLNAAIALSILFLGPEIAGAAAWHAGWMRIAWRVAGSWIAAGGLLLLGWSLR